MRAGDGDKVNKSKERGNKISEKGAQKSYARLYE